jgi:hypothetical protein
VSTIQSAIERRRRLFSPVNAVADHGIAMRNGAPVPPTVVVELFHVKPQISEVFHIVQPLLPRHRHLRQGIFRGQRVPRVGLKLHDLTVADILQVVSEDFLIPVIDILSSRRNANIVRPRQVVAYLARNMTGLSLPAIGRRLGDRDHTTILSGIRKIERLVDSDQGFALRLARIRAELAPF